MHFSQPTVSSRIRSLEEELGQKLLDRTGKEIQLTKAGHFFYNYALKIVETADEATKLIDEFSPELKLTVGATPFCSKHILTKIIPKLQAHPDYMPVKIRTSHQHHLIELFINEIVDAVLISAHDLTKTPHVSFLWKEPTVLVTGNNYALNHNELFQIEQLSDYPISLLSPDYDIDHYSHQLINYCKEFDISFKPTLVADNLEILIQLVKQDSSISLLPLLSVEKEIDNRELINIPYQFPIDLSSNIYLLSRTNTKNEFHSYFYDLIKQFTEKRMNDLANY